MHSHHSHSGDYVSHAHGSLEDMVATARRRGFSHFCLTEHMPRYNHAYLYPEELDKNYTTATLHDVFERYLEHARRIQANSKDLHILVGFEVEGVDVPHIEHARGYLPRFDMCVGSVHYVNGIPIDFDQSLWFKARDSCGSTRLLYQAYFDLQHKVLQALHPNVVGHFDLIRLFDPDASTVSIRHDWPEVWDAIVRNIDCVVEYGGLFELNSSAIRKGWSTPYPQLDICHEIFARGGRFCLSDDSHTVDQVGLNYHKVWDYVKSLGLSTIYYLDLDGKETVVRAASVGDLSMSDFWSQYNSLV